MKKLILLIGLLFAISLNAQSDMLLLFGGGEWNPTDVDGNTLAYYDGDKELTTSGWVDQFSTHDIVFHDTPTITADATPNRNAVLFNGVDEGGTVATPTRTQPYTMYIVYKPVVWGNSDYIFDDGATTSNGLFYMSSVTPDNKMYAGTNLLDNPSVAVGDYGIVTLVFNGASSVVRTNLETGVSGDAGALNGSGITIGEALDNTKESNVEIAYIIIRSGADDTAMQTTIIGELSTLCGLGL